MRNLVVGIIGCGAIGGFIARSIDSGVVPRVEVRVVYDRNIDRCEALVSDLRCKPRIARSFDELLSEDLDLVIEAASQDAVRMYAIPILRSGKDLMIMSVGALVDEDLLSRIREEASRMGRRVYIPSGAVVGVDGIRAACIGGIRRVVLTTRKPPRSFIGDEYVEKMSIDPESVREPTLIFDGSARDACRLLPRSVNIASTIALAGIGADRTSVKIYIDPGVDRNIHELYVEGEFGEFRIETRNVQFPLNPKTSMIAALSALALLKSIVDPIKIG
ncbi:MAG: aspartate dehydrogenase [Candidatus Bathyarchaeia archaeon]|nr:aspartate dehydrogenase [Candidatus Bathyarchaeota archaeon]